MLKNYKDLKVWQKSYKLCLEVYQVTKDFPKEERCGLTSQMKRASVSVPSNIAEGYGRKTTPEYVHSLYMAYGSNCGLDTQLLIASDLGYIKLEDRERLQKGVEEVERMLKALIRALKNKNLNPGTLVEKESRGQGFEKQVQKLNGSRVKQSNSEKQIANCQTEVK